MKERNVSGLKQESEAIGNNHGSPVVSVVCILSAIAIATTLIYPSISVGDEIKEDCDQYLNTSSSEKVGSVIPGITPDMEPLDREQQYKEAWKLLKNEGAENDQKLAVYLFCKSATAGYKHAEWKFATFFREGKLVPKNSEKAFYWMLRAAKHGNGPAQSSVARMYRDGEGTEKNEVEENKWTELVNRRVVREVGVMMELKRSFDQSEKELKEINK